MRVRSIDDVTAAGDLAWFASGIDRIRALNEGGQEYGFLDTSRPYLLARAPGRLDVMGGIADYSGSLVLEMPLACATFAAAQSQEARRIDVISIRGDRRFTFSIDIGRVLHGDLASAPALARFFADSPDDRWASYVMGSIFACLTNGGAGRLEHGVRVALVSDVPEGKGVSSSAALEVAVMSATAACYGIELEGHALATLSQWAENHVAGAPCGIMDQMTSALGRRDRLLRLECQPATVEGHVAIPAGYRFYGIDSGIRHAVTGADYGTVRTAAFMGLRMIDAARLNGYLANLEPEEFATQFVDRLPVRMRGAEFLERYDGITDRVTRVEADRWYPVRAATSHPVYEHDRVTRFAELLESDVVSEEIAVRMGNLMFESHGSYSLCGLGSDGTDRLVELVAETDPAKGVFGAKITGGGSGGTVAVLATEAARDEVHRIARTYERENGRSAFVFDGSGPGAQELGVVVIPSGAP